MTGSLPPEWQPTDLDRELLQRDYERAGLGPEPGSDPRLVAVVCTFIRRPEQADR